MQGQDKGLILWQEKALIEHILDSLPKDIDEIIINANRNENLYKKYGHKVIKDNLKDFQGPLAGILSSMKHCKHNYLLCVPCDSPRPPEELTERLITCLQSHSSLCAMSYDGKREQPLFSLISCDAKPLLENYLIQGKRKVLDFFHLINASVCDFSDQANRFKNFNTQDDLK